MTPPNANKITTAKITTPSNQFPRTLKTTLKNHKRRTVSHILIKRARNNNYTYREKDKETPLITYPDKKDTSTFSTSKDETDCCSISWLSLHQNNFIYYLFNLLYLYAILYSSLDSMMSHISLKTDPPQSNYRYRLQNCQQHCLCSLGSP